MSDDLVPEADAVEQDQLVQDPVNAPDVIDVPLDANEADVIEQAQPGPVLDEDEGFAR